MLADSHVIEVSTSLPGIPAQIHYPSPYAWPSHALRNETWAPPEMAEMQTLQWLENTLCSKYIFRSYIYANIHQLLKVSKLIYIIAHVNDCLQTRQCSSCTLPRLSLVDGSGVISMLSLSPTLFSSCRILGIWGDAFCTSSSSALTSGSKDTALVLRLQHKYRRTNNAFYADWKTGKVNTSVVRCLV